MRLSLISENISRQEFFDFYSLEYAYSKFPEREIEQHLRSLASHILDDHLNQLGQILINRLSNTEDEETMEVLERFGVRNVEDSLYGHVLGGIDDLTLEQKASVITAVLKIGRHPDFTGETWRGLGKKFFELYRGGSSRQAQISTIDKLYNLLHHGGMIIDYMDENDWLEDALHTRDNANPSQLFALSSSGVRSLIGRSTYEKKQGSVSEIDKLYTAVRRAGTKSGGISASKKSDNELVIEVDFLPLRGSDSNAFSFNALGGKIHPTHQKMIDNGKMVIGEPLKGSITIKDIGDRFEFISGDFSTTAVGKPLNRQYSLVNDLVSVAMHVADNIATGRGVGARPGINPSRVVFGNIERNPYYITDASMLKRRQEIEAERKTRQAAKA